MVGQEDFGGRRSRSMNSFILTFRYIIHHKVAGKIQFSLYQNPKPKLVLLSFPPSLLPSSVLFCQIYYSKIIHFIMFAKYFIQKLFIL